jgi:hypothetical protein
MSLIAQISGGVSRCGDVRGQDDSTLSAHASCRRQVWNRLGDTCRNCRSARNGMYARARSTARPSCILLRPSASRSCDKSNPERRHTTSTSRSSAASLRTPSAELEDLPSKVRLTEVRHVHTDDAPRRRTEPPTGRRARNPEIPGDGRVPGVVDQIPKPVVIAPLRAGRGRHGDDHRPSDHTAQLRREASGFHRCESDRSPP